MHPAAWGAVASHWDGAGHPRLPGRAANVAKPWNSVPWQCRCTVGTSFDRTQKEDETMRALTPWPGTGLRKDMERLFERFFDPMGDMPALGAWEPKLDIAETKDGLTVKAEIPGVKQEDIQLSLQDGVLTIKGEKEEEKEEKDQHYHRVERSYGSFLRSVRLPASVDAGKVTATFKNGVLTVTMPKTAEAKGTTIPVKSA
jgi:HSP20 family protein